jgi:hypothetical protein
VAPAIHALASGSLRLSLVVHLSTIENVVRIMATGAGPVEQISDQLDR